MHRDANLFGWVVALSVGHRTCNLQVAGLNPASAPLRSGLETATYTCVPLSPSSIGLYLYLCVLFWSGAKPRGFGEEGGEVQTPHTSQRRLMGFAQIR